MPDWNRINERIKECRKQHDPGSCLRALFDETGDGMAAFALAEQLETRSTFQEALYYFKEAEQRFSMERYKQQAREAIKRIQGLIAALSATAQPPEREPEADETLYIVNCTKTKIWDRDKHAPAYVPARDAYVGASMCEWLQSGWYRQGYYWVILSAKYGFIEPDRPIGYYDVTFDDERTGPLSLESLRAQVEHQSRGANRKRLSDFRHVRVFGSELYLAMVRAAFMRVCADVAAINS